MDTDITLCSGERENVVTIDNIRERMDQAERDLVSQSTITAAWFRLMAMNQLSQKITTLPEMEVMLDKIEYSAIAERIVVMVCQKRVHHERNHKDAFEVSCIFCLRTVQE